MATTERSLPERLAIAPGMLRQVAAWTPDPLAERALVAAAALLDELVADAQAAHDELAKLRMAQSQAPRMEGDG